MRNTDPATIRAGIYTRISDDAKHDELGVKRQEKECRDLAARRGWEVIAVYVDDDRSAYSGKPRPAYQRLVEDIRAGAVDALVAWHPDRLHRSPLELEGFIPLIQQTGCEVTTVKAGGWDLSTAGGRVNARNLSNYARYESETKSDRMKSKHKQLAEDGKDGGSGRPFGYEADRKTIRPSEVPWVQEAKDRALEGEALRSVMRDANRRGIKSATGRQWSVKTLKGMLVSARISGRREHGTDARGKRLVIGPITNEHADWPGIITPEESDRLRAILTDPARRQGQHGTKYLLTGGIAICGLDGARLMARPKQNWRKGEPSIPSIVCSARPGHMRIASGPLEQLVSEAVLQAVDKGKLTKALRGTGEDRKAVDELTSVEQKLADLAKDYASDGITRGEWEAARKTLRARQDALRRRVETSRRQVGLDGLPDPLRTAWPSLPLHRKQAVVSMLVEAVVIGRGVPGLNRFDPRRVTIRWKV